MASASCAAGLREGGFDGELALVGREADPPYSRPPASKGYLAGRESRDDALFHPADWYAEHRVRLLTRTSVMKLDLAAREARLSTKETLGFDQALVATGANVRRLPVDGADLEGLHYLRALRNADALRDDVADAERVVLVGGSYIASEVAATLTVMGKRCTMVMQEDLPLSTAFGRTAGAALADLLGAHGVELVTGDEVARLEGDDERVARVVLASGRVLEAGAVVLGVGAVPDVMLARAAGLALGERGGVRCDDRLRTSAPGVYAAGDVCEYDSVLHDGPVRIEHWDVAVQHGRTVADNMLGADRPHTAVPYFWSDLADWAMLEYVGPAIDGWDEEVVRGTPGDGPWAVWYLRGGRVVAALSVGGCVDLDHARRLLADRTPVGEHREALADPATDLAAVG